MDIRGKKPFFFKNPMLFQDPSNAIFAGYLTIVIHGQWPKSFHLGESR